MYLDDEAREELIRICDELDWSRVDFGSMNDDDLMTFSSYVHMASKPMYGEGERKVFTCKCGHSYERHFDPYQNMDHVGCKYCDCDQFDEPPRAPKFEIDQMCAISFSTMEFDKGSAGRVRQYKWDDEASSWIYKIICINGNDLTESVNEKDLTAIEKDE